MKGYTAREVAAMVGLSEQQVRSFARSGFLHPDRGTRGEYRFNFHDIVLLRAARGLTEAHIPPRRIRASLNRLREQLPGGRPLTAVRIAADGRRVVVRDGDTVWSPDSGQVLFDFDVAELASRAEPLARRAAREAAEDQGIRSADDWFDLAADTEISAPDEARALYLRALDLDPSHPEAHINLGRLLHDEGDVVQAMDHYRAALVSAPDDPVAAFNLGVALEDLGRPDEALDAHYNLAGLHERMGNKAEALRHLRTYKKLIDR
jgi:tetratricopeptide (TPR) repeat protein